MTPKKESSILPPSTGENTQKYPGRRRLLTASTAGAGVFLAMQAKTALGTTTCQSPSAQISGAHSPRTGDGHVCSGGRSPGFWKTPQHFSYWAASGLTPPTFSVAVEPCMKGLGDLTPCNISNIGTTIETIFPGAPGGTKGIWEALAWPAQYPNVSRTASGCVQIQGNTDVFAGKGQLIRHLACAYLNAGYFNSASQDYPLTKEQVKVIWLAVGFGGVYCPEGMTCSASTAWNATKVIEYIQGLYGVNAEVEGDLCKRT